MMVGAFWEVLEFTIDLTFDTNTQRSGIPDTMTDLIADAVGATWGAFAVQIGLSRGVMVPGGGLVVEYLRLNPIVYGRWPEWSARLEKRRGRALAAHDGAFERGRQAGGDVIAGQD